MNWGCEVVMDEEGERGIEGSSMLIVFVIIIGMHCYGNNALSFGDGKALAEVSRSTVAILTSVMIHHRGVSLSKQQTDLSLQKGGFVTHK